MKIKLRLLTCSEPIVFEDVVTAYQKMDFYCIRLNPSTTLKYPLSNVFSVEEISEHYTCKEEE